MGVSSMTGPTPNNGYEAAGLQKLGMVVKMLTDILPLLGAGSEGGQAVLKALGSLAKLVPTGSVSPAGERNSLQSILMQNAQQNQQMKLLQQRAMTPQPQQPAQAGAQMRAA